MQVPLMAVTAKYGRGSYYALLDRRKKEKKETDDRSDGPTCLMTASISSVSAGFATKIGTSLAAGIFAATSARACHDTKRTAASNGRSRQICSQDKYEGELKYVRCCEVSKQRLEKAHEGGANGRVWRVVQGGAAAAVAQARLLGSA